jgi:hypothetical protein
VSSLRSDLIDRNYLSALLAERPKAYHGATQIGQHRPHVREEELPMPLRKLNVRNLKPFVCDHGSPIKWEMADVGRTLGSERIGLVVQTVRPGCHTKGSFD